MLVNPPCTGLGVLSSRPDARWRRREESLEPLTRLQAGLLARALELVRPGGRVVYSTCTLIAAENEDVVRAVGAPLDDLAARVPRHGAPAASRGAAHPAAPARHRRVLHRAAAPAGGRGVSGLPDRPVVLPSLMSADMLRLGEQLDALIAAGATAVHVDVMDASFVPNLTVGPDWTRAIAGPVRRPGGRSTCT